MALPSFLVNLIENNRPKGRLKYDLTPLLEGDLEHGARIYAKAAEYQGTGDLWKVWYEIQKFRGKELEEAIQDLDSQGRRWFAKWAFANNQSDAGEIAYKAYLKEPGDIGPFDHESGVFLDHLLEKDRWKEVIETVDQLKAEYDDVPWEETRAIRAELALGNSANAVQRLQTILDRHHDSGDYWAFSAIIHARLGKKKQAELAFQESVRLGVIEESFLEEMFSVLKLRPDEWKELRAPYDLGGAFPEQQAKEWWKNPGARLDLSPGPSAHWFGGDDFRMPACRGCGHPIRQWFLLDIRAIEPLQEKLPAWSYFPLLGCTDCMVWMGRHDYEVDQQTMTVRLVNVGTSTKRYGGALSTLPAISKQFVQLNWIPPNENPTEEELQVWERPQVGGIPLWIQDPLNVFCKSCRKEMVFVAAMASTPGFEPYIPIEVGYLYHFACNNCHTLSVIAQWT